MLDANLESELYPDRELTCPLILAMDFPDRIALGQALESQERQASRAATQRTLPGLFEGQIFHYLTETEVSHSC